MRLFLVATLNMPCPLESVSCELSLCWSAGSLSTDPPTSGAPAAPSRHASEHAASLPRCLPAGTANLDMDPLDDSRIHPESYDFAIQVRAERSFPSALDGLLPCCFARAHGRGGHGVGSLGNIRLVSLCAWRERRRRVSAEGGPCFSH